MDHLCFGISGLGGPITVGDIKNLTFRNRNTSVTTIRNYDIFFTTIRLNNARYSRTVTQKSVRVKMVRRTGFGNRKWSGRTNLRRPNLVRPD